VDVLHLLGVESVMNDCLDSITGSLDFDQFGASDIDAVGKNDYVAATAD
jgi:hypothetical protein